MYQSLGVETFEILREFGKLNAPTIDPQFRLNPTTLSRKKLTQLSTDVVPTQT